MTIHELIELLQQYNQEAEIVATWEGMDVPFDVYQAADGRVMIDADNNHYKVKWQKLKCEVCGVPARNAPFCDKPVCYNHWFTFEKK
jgi:hypothetical protein